MEHISDTGFSIKGYCEFIITNNCTITPNSDMNNLVFIKANDGATGIIRITRFKVLTLVNSTYVYKLTPDNVSPITDIYNAGTLNIPEQPSPTGRKIWDLPLIAYTDNTAARSAGKLNGNIYINSITNALSIVVP